MPLFFFLWLFIEIASFIIIGQIVGVFFTLVLVIASMMYGFSLIRKAGEMGARSAYQDFRAGRTLPFLVLSGILLIIPGFFSSLLGLLLLLPLIRDLWSQRTGRAASSTPANDPSVIEGEFTRKDDK